MCREQKIHNACEFAAVMSVVRRSALGSLVLDPRLAPHDAQGVCLLVRLSGSTRGLVKCVAAGSAATEGHAMREGALWATTPS